MAAILGPGWIITLLLSALHWYWLITLTKNRPGSLVVNEGPISPLFQNNCQVGGCGPAYETILGVPAQNWLAVAENPSGTGFTSTVNWGVIAVQPVVALVMVTP